MKICIKSAQNEDILEVVRKSMRFYAEILMPRIKNDLSIMVNLDHDFSKSFLATVDVLDDSVRPRKFKIKVRRGLSGRKLFETIAHEMVHVKQYAYDELYDYQNPTTVRFRGKVYRDIDSKSIDYWLYPWEVEAFGKSYGLYKKFLEEYDLKPSDLRINRGRMRACKKM
jgi:hypothetical protein